MLEAMGLSLDAVDRVFVTHFDGDHFRPTWTKALSALTRIHMHERHVRSAQKKGVRSTQLEALDGAIQEVGGQTRVSCLLAAHDSTGVAAFRFEHAGASIGFATDVGQVTQRLVEHVKGVHLLAVESNYCPRLQAASNRPEFLKARIMGGKGHLSNKQCAELTREAHPKSDVVLLHLSQQCNRPQLAAKEHAGAPYRLTIAAQDQPTPWIAVRPNASAGISKGVSNWIKGVQVSHRQHVESSSR